MKNFPELKVWQKSHTLTLEVYPTTRSFPPEEVYGLVSQIQRSSSSIPTNIAEGSGREGGQEFHRYLSIAFGWANELDCQLLLAHDLEYISTERYHQLYKPLVEVKQMPYRLMQKPKADG